MPLFIAFIVIPIIEIAVLIKVGSLIGVLPTIALILLTAIVGTAVVRTQGFQVLARARATMARGSFPAHELAEGVTLLFAGLLLITPGFVTDTCGILLLIPGVRTVLGRLLIGWLLSPRRGGTRTHWTWTTRRHGPEGRKPGAPESGTIEGEYKVIPPEHLPPDDNDRRR